MRTERCLGSRGERLVSEEDPADAKQLSRLLCPVDSAQHSSNIRWVSQCVRCHSNDDDRHQKP
jgi:cytochrome c553